MVLFSTFDYPRCSMRRKLFGYMLLLAAILLAALMVGLSLFGRFSSVEKRSYEALDIHMENETVHNENSRLQLAYQQALDVYEKVQQRCSAAQDELTTAKRELERLAYSRKNEIDPDDYQNFLDGMRTLTKSERAIFNWYLEGKSAKEILDLTGIKEGTLKFHNHNILNKLGVSSRKQMLRYAALMKQQDAADVCDCSGK